jgi:hypothetical protein
MEFKNRNVVHEIQYFADHLMPLCGAPNRSSIAEIDSGAGCDHAAMRLSLGLGSDVFEGAIPIIQAAMHIPPATSNSGCAVRHGIQP